MMKNIFYSCMLLLLTSFVHAQTPKQSAEALLQRIIPQRASAFVVAIIPAENDNDVFEVESSNGKIILRGNTPVSVASAFYHYLTQYCHIQVSWSSDEITLRAKLPVLNQKIKITTPYKQRVYFNYCTFSYTMPWWDWSRWEKEIDWMALHGINMPLAITGQEAVWQNTLRKFRMSDDEIRKFLVGPAYFAWQFMTNIEGWNGPLPQSWIDSHIALGKQILQRERALGMTPILQGFTGYVPKRLKQKYPDAKIDVKGDWYGVPPGSGQLDPLDPLFKEMGTTFLQEQEKLFGTDHYYAADPFHEGEPASNTPEYLHNVGETIFNITKVVDPHAVIAMQTWSLREPIVKAIPKENLLLLDLVGTNWKKNKSFWGYNWVAGILHNYGGRVFMGGNLASYTSNAPELLSNKEAGNLSGIGMFPEAIEHNPVVYEGAAALTWTTTPLQLPEWIQQYAYNRYGTKDKAAGDAWSILLQTVYAQRITEPSMESVICARPILHFTKVAPNGDTRREYDQQRLWHAWDTLLRVAPAIKNNGAYQYDLVDVARQCLVDMAIPMQQRIATAYETKDTATLRLEINRFLNLMDDIDDLLATRKEFLLGKWIYEAKAWGTNDAERKLYERNARTLITTWGPVSPQAVQYDYSNRQWSGLIKGYYKIRWQKFFNFLLAQPFNDGCYTEKGLKLTYGRPSYDANDFYKQLAQWENNWLNDTSTFDYTPKGNAVEIARKLFQKWSLPPRQ